MRTYRALWAKQAISLGSRSSHVPDVGEVVPVIALSYSSGSWFDLAGLAWTFRVTTSMKALDLFAPGS